MSFVGTTEFTSLTSKAAIDAGASPDDPVLRQGLNRRVIALLKDARLPFEMRNGRMFVDPTLAATAATLLGVVTADQGQSSGKSQRATA